MTPEQRQEVHRHLSHDLRRTLFEVSAEVSLMGDFSDASPVTFHVAVHTGGQPTAEAIATSFVTSLSVKVRIIGTRSIGEGLPLSQTGLPEKKA